MGKLFNSMVMGIGITVALWLFNGNGFEATSVVFFLLNPSAYKTSEFWTSLTVFASVGSLVVIGIGALIKQDWLYRAGIVGSIASIVLSPYIALFTFLSGQTNYISACESSVGTTGVTLCSQLNEIGGIGQIIALVVAGPLLLYALWACYSWIFSPESSG